LLVVEVADSSLRQDRTLKAALYAEFSVLEYWIFDLNAKRVEVYREPGRDEKGRPRYSAVETLEPSASVVPIHSGGRAVVVKSLMPA